MLIVLASIDTVLNISKTFLGVGGLIFVHELGHFLVGRWCGVHAEAFSIGFGPVLLKWRGKPKDPARPDQTTEYRLSAIPLGGYVKFLGENPDERGERDPRSFHAATFPRKVAIMLAGVTMNLLAALVLFVITFRMGWDATAPVVGGLTPGAPAWEHGVKKGDEFVSINGNRILEFSDVIQETAYSDSVDVVLRRDGALLPAFRFATRDLGEGMPQIGVGPADDGVIRLVPVSDSAVKAPDFKDGDRVVAVEGTPVRTVSDAFEAMTEGRSDAVWTVDRGGANTDVNVPWTTSRRPRLGVLPGGDRLVVQGAGSAHAAGLRTGDEPVRVGAVATPTARAFVGAIADAANLGSVVVRRDAKEVTAPLPLGAERNAFAKSVAGRVEPGRVWITLEGVRAAAESKKPVALRWVGPDGTETTTQMSPEELPDALPEIAGIATDHQKRMVHEQNLAAAVALGVNRTHRWVMRIFSTISSIFSGRVSGSKLSGPIGIAMGTYSQAERSWADFLLFLGMISMNLAVLNVLPLPLLDGGQLTVHTIERIRGKPIPERILEGVQWAGLLLLLSLLVYVTKNDIVMLMRM